MLHRIRPLFSMFAVCAALALAGCPSSVESSAPPSEDDSKTDDTGDDPVDDPGDDTSDDTRPFRVVIMPASPLSVAVGGEAEISIFAENSAGELISGAGNATLISSETDIATTAVEGSSGGTTTATITGEAPGTAILTATLGGLTATKNVTVTGEGEEDDDDVDDVDWQHCCPLATSGPEDKNMCYIPPDEPGCPMTADEGYCDEDGDDNYSTPDPNYPDCESNGDGCHNSGWVQGWKDANEHC